MDKRGKLQTTNSFQSRLNSKPASASRVVLDKIDIIASLHTSTCLHTCTCVHTSTCLHRRACILPAEEGLGSRMETLNYSQRICNKNERQLNGEGTFLPINSAETRCSKVKDQS